MAGRRVKRIPPRRNSLPNMWDKDACTVRLDDDFYYALYQTQEKFLYRQNIIDLFDELRLPYNDIYGPWYTWLQVPTWLHTALYTFIRCENTHHEMRLKEWLQKLFCDETGTYPRSHNEQASLNDGTSQRDPPSKR